ncbi:unnamed protein product [Rotaria sp. Silwood2]|nr:unnamed protein product [Rotaria sp. Silwood2]CAF4426966.1 unnamed protein product [Rotaria sp. Silwood2]
MFEALFCDLFSDVCRLVTLRLDISQLSTDFYKNLYSYYQLESNKTSVGYQSCCLTLRHLDIRIRLGCILEHIIDSTPNLEQLSILLESSSTEKYYPSSNIQSTISTNKNWFHKLPKLERFKLKSNVYDDFGFEYVKWLLNRINYIKKLEIHLYDGCPWKKKRTIWKSFIDANFIRQYCLPDEIINLEDFRFSICAQCQLSSDDIEKTINSFKIHSFFY